MVAAMPRKRLELHALAARPIGDGPPEWIVLVPAGDEVRTRDGRAWRSPGADALIAAHARQDLMLPVDLNHSEIYVAPFGGDSPAYGWVTELEKRDDAVWGKVEWTEAGLTEVRTLRYRYYSPCFAVALSTDGTQTIEVLTSVALCNRPALRVAALARQEEFMADPIREKLGLADGASEQEVLDAIDRRTAAAAQPPAGQPPGQPAAAAPDMVPRADYDVVAARANTAETALAQRAADDLRTEAEGLVDAAIRDGKVAPSSRGYHLETCRTREDVDRFKAFAAAAPVVLAANSAAAPAGAPPNTGEQWEPEQQRLIRAAGLDPKDVPVERA